MIVSGYSMDLYCDTPPSDKRRHKRETFMHQFTGETYGDCAKQARRTGWRLTRDNRAICPLCTRKVR
jgi:hypothetical protein